MIYALDKNFKIIDVIRKYEFAQYVEKFRDIGTFVINIILTDENKYIINDDKVKYIYFDYDKKIIGKITSIKKEEDSKIFKIEGKLANYIFTKRVVNGKYQYTDDAEKFINRLVRGTITDSGNSDRYINIQLYEGELDTDGLPKRIRSAIGGYLWDRINQHLEMDKLGINFYPEIVPTQSIDGVETNVKKWHLKVLRGSDRTKGNTKGNIPIVFSSRYSNIDYILYEKNIENYYTSIYAMGEKVDGEYPFFTKEKAFESLYDKEVTSGRSENTNVCAFTDSTATLKYKNYSSLDIKGGSVEFYMGNSNFIDYRGRVLKITTNVPETTIPPYIITDINNVTEVIDSGETGSLHYNELEVFIPDNAQRLIVNYERGNGQNFKLNGGDVISEKSIGVGWERLEYYVDATGVSHQDENGKQLTDSEYSSLISERIEEETKDNVIFEKFDAVVISEDKRYQYNEDFFLGDWCTIEDEMLGKSLDAQITEVTTSIQGSQKIIDITFVEGMEKHNVVDVAMSNLKQLKTIGFDIEHIKKSISNLWNK